MRIYIQYFDPLGSLLFGLISIDLKKTYIKQTEGYLSQSF